MASNESKKLNKTNCINNLAIGDCCLLNQCKCKNYDRNTKPKKINNT